MTEAEETRLENLSRKQGFETLNERELNELKRLTEKKALEGRARTGHSRQRPRAG